MRKQILFTLILFLPHLHVFSQEQSGKTGVGIRLGDPFGFTGKIYLNHSSAVQVNIGRSGWWWGHGYYGNRFYDVNELKGYYYENSRLLFAGSLQGHYLYHFDISINADKILKEMDVDKPDIDELKGLLQFYVGGGIQIRYASVRYWYRYKVYYGPGGNDYYWTSADGIYPDLDFGWDGVAGMEYHFKKYPVSVFGEGNLFIEVFDDFFFPRIQIGVGGRYWL